MHAHTSVEAFGTSTEVHAHPQIDSVFVAGSQDYRYNEALSALRANKGVLLLKPVSMTCTEAKELCETAKKSSRTWLGMLMHIRQDKHRLLWAADECAQCLSEGKCESEQLSWKESLTIIEALDELRIDPDIHRSPLEDSVTAFPKMDSPETSFNSLDARRPGSRASLGSDATFHSQATGDDTSKSTHLRSQIHELKHILRQKSAMISSLEQKAGLAPGSTERQQVRARSRNSLPAPGVREAMARSPSPLFMQRSRTGSSGHTDEDGHTPLGDVANTTDTPNGMPSRRRRKDATSSPTPDWTSSPTSGTNQLGLETVPENGKKGEGFLSPTIASESRRLATTAGLSSPISPIPSSQASGKGTGKVIESLTNELHTAKAALDATKTQLRAVQRNVTSLQRSLDETRETLGRSRTENEKASQMMSRKERQVQEVLERARKAETEAKELGKSSREWGARVRHIEAQLGEERIHKQRAEMQYEALSTTWKQIREAWEKEMDELRESQGDAVRRNREETQRILSKFQAAQQEWAGRQEAGEALGSVVVQLERERKKAAEAVEAPVKEMMASLNECEAHASRQDAAVQEVQDELKRILRLMRTPG